MKPLVTYINPSIYTNIVYSRLHDSDLLLQQEYAKQGDIILETSTYKTGILRIHNTKFIFAGHIQYDNDGNIISQETYDDRYLKVNKNESTGKSTIDATNATIDLDSVILKKIFYKDSQGNLVLFGHSRGDNFIIDTPFDTKNFYINGNSFIDTYPTLLNVSINFQSKLEAKNASEQVTKDISVLNTSVLNKFTEVSTWLDTIKENTSTNLDKVYQTIRDESTYLYDNSTGISVKNTSVEDITSLKKAITLLLEDKYYITPQPVRVTTSVNPATFVNGYNTPITFSWIYNNYNLPDTSKLVTKFDNLETNIISHLILSSGIKTNIVKRLEVSTKFRDSRNVQPTTFVTNMVCRCVTKLFYVVSDHEITSEPDIINLFKQGPVKEFSEDSKTINVTIGDENKYVYFTLYSKSNPVFYIYEQGTARGFSGGVMNVTPMSYTLPSGDYPVQYTVYRTIQKLNTRNNLIIIEIQ